MAPHGRGDADQRVTSGPRPDLRTDRSNRVLAAGRAYGGEPVAIVKARGSTAPVNRLEQSTDPIS
jgi:hypothetical protein